MKISLSKSDIDEYRKDEGSLSDSEIILDSELRNRRDNLERP